MKRRLGLIYLGIFVVTVILLIPLNMLAFEDTLAEAVVSPYMWMETVILAGILIYLISSTPPLVTASVLASGRSGDR
ncbi:MAG TPA: hypothetical protein VK988_05405 [Acidimicrobiales bacterium]|nr:hypothetical protein [Acidimicrobiales bacterium]